MRRRVTSATVDEAITSALNRVSKDHPSVVVKFVRTHPRYAVTLPCLPFIETEDGQQVYLVYESPEKPIAVSMPNDPGAAHAYATFEEFLVVADGGDLSAQLIEDLDALGT